MTWRFDIANADGTGAEALDGASGWSLTFNLQDYCTAEFSIDGRHPRAALIGELTTDVFAYRDNVLMYRGRVGAPSDDIDANTHEAKRSTADYRWLLAHRTLWPGSTASFTTVDQSDIAWTLIDDSQSLPGGDWGITRGVGATTGVDRTRPYEVGAVITELLTNLGNVSGGFEWDVGADLKFNIYHPTRGALSGFAVTYGPTGGNVQKLGRGFDPGTYANAIRQSGADGVGPTTRVASDIASRPEGRWELQVSDTNLTTTGAVADAADATIATASDIEPSYTVTLSRDSGWSPDVLWLGDTCPVRIQSGYLDIDVTLRVTSIQIAPDDGGEVVSLTFGLRPPSLRSRVRGIASNVANLARR